MNIHELLNNAHYTLCWHIAALLQRDTAQQKYWPTFHFFTPMDYIFTSNNNSLQTLHCIMCNIWHCHLETLWQFLQRRLNEKVINLMQHLSSCTDTTQTSEYLQHLFPNSHFIHGWNAFNSSLSSLLHYLMHSCMICFTRIPCKIELGENKKWIPNANPIFFILAGGSYFKVRLR